MQKMGNLYGFNVFLRQEGALGLKEGLIMVVWHVSITTSNSICLTVSNGFNKVMPFFTPLPVMVVCFHVFSPLEGATKDFICVFICITGFLGQFMRE